MTAAGDGAAPAAPEGAANAGEVRARVLALLRRHGWNTTSFQVLERDYRYWFAGDACVAYVDTGRAWVAAGAPIAAASEVASVAHAFVSAAREAGRRASFFGVEAPFVAAAGLPVFKIGEQPVWDPRRWDEGLQASRSLREQLRKARAKGVAVRHVASAELAPGAPLRRAVDALIVRWQASRPMPPMGFLVDLEPYEFADERRYVVAEVRGELVGFLAAVPVYGRAGWFVEDLVRAPEAPSGVNALMVDLAMRRFAAEGASFATLGMLPLAGVDGWLRWVRERARALYDFAGLATFKQRLKPLAIDPIWLAHPPAVGRVTALRDVLTAFARGSLVRFGLATLTRGGPRMLALLALLLLPWCVGLALAPERWFPSLGVRLGWIAFDLTLASVLWLLARRYRPRLGALALGMTSLDVVLTLAQAALWNAARTTGVVDVTLLVMGSLAPLIGLAITTGAWRRHRRLRGHSRHPSI